MTSLWLDGEYPILIDNEHIKIWRMSPNSYIIDCDNRFIKDITTIADVKHVLGVFIDDRMYLRIVFDYFTYKNDLFRRIRNLVVWLITGE